MSRRKTDPRDLAIIGWREWVALPEFGVQQIKAKIDTGARTSAIHAWHIDIADRDGVPWVDFDLHPVQRDSSAVVRASARLVETREVRDSGGKRTRRPVVVTPVRLGSPEGAVDAGREWLIELTLVARDQMGFRMLLGREAVRGRYLVDPMSSYRHLDDSPDSVRARKSGRSRTKKRGGRGS